MKSATLTRHLRSSGCTSMHVSYGNIIWEYLFSIWTGLFESRHFALYRYIFMSVRQTYTEFRSFALKFTEIKMAESASCLLSLFYKSAMFCCYCECTQINVESLQIRKMYYSYLYDQKWQSILRASERTGASICHADRAAIQLQTRLSGHVKLLILTYFRCKCLDVLPDVATTYQPLTICVPMWVYLVFFCDQKKFWSTKPLLVD